MTQNENTTSIKPNWYFMTMLLVYVSIAAVLNYRPSLFGLPEESAALDVIRSLFGITVGIVVIVCRNHFWVTYQAPGAEKQTGGSD